MFVISLCRRSGGTEPITLWLKTASPLRLDVRDKAMQFKTKGEAGRVAAGAKLVGWTLEDA